MLLSWLSRLAILPVLLLSLGILVLCICTLLRELIVRLCTRILTLLTVLSV